jgi:tRNA threonylcarbamoyladenosine biosynthesis protein TsaB
MFVEGYLASLNRWYIIDKTPSSFEYCLILFLSALVVIEKNKIKMNKLVIDIVGEIFFLAIISDDVLYSISHKNSKTNYEKLIVLLNDLLSSKGLKIGDISSIYVNRGPGSYAGIRNSLSIVKAIHLAKKIDYYCFSFKDFVNEKNIKYENVPNLCNKFKIKKNLIKPIYIS